MKTIDWQEIHKWMFLIEDWWAIWSVTLEVLTEPVFSNDQWTFKWWLMTSKWKIVKEVDYLVTVWLEHYWPKLHKVFRWIDASDLVNIWLPVHIKAKDTPYWVVIFEVMKDWQLEDFVDLLKAWAKSKWLEFTFTLLER